MELNLIEHMASFVGYTNAEGAFNPGNKLHLLRSQNKGISIKVRAVNNRLNYA